jgi:hypothetical protein
VRGRASLEGLVEVLRAKEAFAVQLEGGDAGLGEAAAKLRRQARRTGPGERREKRASARGKGDGLRREAGVRFRWWGSIRDVRARSPEFGMRTMWIPVSPFGKYSPLGEPCPSSYNLGAAAAVGAAKDGERCSEPAEVRAGHGFGVQTIVRSAASLPALDALKASWKAGAMCIRLRRLRR